ncbi:hypothetical protein R3W88_016250 [Solanum pinnatisectum]|uniref:Uncharacterized protein n=1 Tax=Solanum pinnatisectum TaxID=50273 RepID=A0AAV9L140_9SOLN|nr:hypothetical protein R3W88_016250 [Solanum pinnatisectum]
MKDNNNEGRKTRNWKRMAKQVGCSVSLKNDTSNATLDKGVVLAECMQYIREKRKGDTELLSVQVCQSHTSHFYVETLVHEVSTDFKYWCIFVYLSTDRVIRKAQLTELTLK